MPPAEAPPPDPEQARLAALARYEILGTSPEASFDRLTRLAARTFGVPMALVTLVDHEQQWNKSCYGLQSGSVPRDLSFCAHALDLGAQEAVLDIPDMQQDERFRRHPLVTGRPFIRSYVGAPLRTPDGFVLGTFCLMDHQPRAPLTAEEQEVLGDLAASAMDLVQYRTVSERLFRTQAALEERQRQVELTLARTSTVLSTLSLQSGEVQMLANYAVLGMNETLAPTTLDASLTWLHPEDRARCEAIVRQALLDGERYTFQSRLQVPADGPMFWTESRGEAQRDASGAVTHLHAVTFDITEQKRLEQALRDANAELERRVQARTAELERLNAQLRHDALHDALTGLPNRTLLTDRLNQAILRQHRQPERCYAALFLDFDRFKLVNDAFGHAAGDRLLMDLARRLTAATKPLNTVARLSGDEFAVLIEDIGTLEDVLPQVEQLQRALQAPFEVAGRLLHITASIGIALCEDRYQHADHVLEDADIAMYRAKVERKGGYVVFDVGMRERQLALMNIQQDLRRAMTDGELRVQYQPVVRLGERSVSGVEALVRWQHPRLGLVSPAEFIPVAEETGLIVDIDLWVLREACHTLKRWNEGRDMPLHLNVNFSALHFQPHRQPDLVETVRQRLHEEAFPPEQLHLEITESLLMADAVSAKEQFQALRALGVRIVLDDFGMGYSGLNYLRQFPLDGLKIDRSFVASITEQPEILRTLVELGRSLTMQVVAEGIEEEAQAAQLQQMACEFGQGFLFSRPTWPEPLPAWLREP